MGASKFRGVRPEFQEMFTGKHLVRSYLLSDGTETYSKKRFEREKFYFQMLEFAYETPEENPDFMASVNLMSMLERGDEIPKVRLQSKKEKDLKKRFKEIFQEIDSELEYRNRDN